MNKASNLIVLLHQSRKKKFPSLWLSMRNGIHLFHLSSNPADQVKVSKSIFSATLHINREEDHQHHIWLVWSCWQDSKFGFGQQAWPKQVVSRSLSASLQRDECNGEEEDWLLQFGCWRLGRAHSENHPLRLFGHKGENKVLQWLSVGGSSLVFKGKHMPVLWSSKYKLI